MNAELDRRYANEEHGAYAFRIHGSVHHLLGPELIPKESNIIQQLRFAQINIFDSANKLQNRINVASDCDVKAHIMQSLQTSLHDVNPFVDLFKSMEKINCINELYRFYDSLQYVMMFPLGDPRWNINVRKHDPSAMEVDEPTTNAADRNRAEVSVMEYHRFPLMIRIDLDS
ncbi:hypothetical protein [Parasitella parasitica]|uniref:Helitron helicase-like domain-containing protein n=1 Tax=Parasitella parasitica TaxID=35722 RepID=A0A0B7NPH8_9FUNG|nr:hypothetical protein [Parasitella parasitica]